MLVDIINLNNPDYNNWLYERIIALKNNKFIGNGFCLQTRGYSEIHQCEAWDYFPVNTIAQIDHWIIIVNEKTN